MIRTGEQILPKNPKEKIKNRNRIGCNQAGEYTNKMAWKPKVKNKRQKTLLLSKDLSLPHVF